MHTGMVSHLAGKLALWGATVWLVITLVFGLLHLLPGDPVLAMLGERASLTDVEALRQSLGLHLPLGQQYVNYWAGLWHGDLGASLVNGRPVTQLLAERAPATVQLAAAAMLVALLVGGLLGVLGAWRGPGQGAAGLRHVSGGAALLIMSLPSFVLGPLLMLALAMGLGWLPVSGSGTWAHLVLPAFTLGLGLAAVIGRMLAANLIQLQHADFARTASAKGAGPARRGWHVARNALLPLVQVVCLQLGMVLTGAVLTETIFGWPGLGNLLVEALNTRDYPVIQGCLLVIALTYVLALALADGLALMLDPRVRQGAASTGGGHA